MGTVIFLDKNVTVECVNNESVLDALIRSGREEVKVGCRRGGCGMCAVKIHAGSSYVMGKMNRQKIGFDVLLACKIYPVGCVFVSTL